MMRRNETMQRSSLVPPSGKKSQIRVLVSTGNMGNAQPDQGSIEAWIPFNGRVDVVDGAGDGKSCVRDAKDSIESLGNSYGDFDVGSDLEDNEGEQGQGNENNPEKKITDPSESNFSDMGADADALSESHNNDIQGRIEEESEVIIDQIISNMGQRNAPENPSYEQFDIIVIGMQESTFDVPTESTRPESTRSSNNSELTQDGAFDPAGAILNTKAVQAVGNVAKFATGNIKTVAQLAMTRNHAKTGKPSSSCTPTSSAGEISSEEPSSSATKSKRPDFIQDMPSLRKIVPLDKVGQNISNLSEWADTAVLHRLFCNQLPSYTKAVSFQKGEMRLLIFYNEAAIDMEVLSVKAQATGIAGLANKGGIVSEVCVNQNTRLSFVTAHLEAHEGQSKYKARCVSFQNIFRGTESNATAGRVDSSLASHFTFFMGDLNFRTRLPNLEPGSKEHIEETHKLVAERNWRKLQQCDELLHALRHEHCLSGFRTPVCDFQPTFKVLRQPGYSYIKKRSPSYTDRILYKTSHQMDSDILTEAYEPICDFASSDHKPIRGVFAIKLNERLKWRPVLQRGPSGVKRSKGLFACFGEKDPILKAPKASSPNRENLHLFCSNIKCQIDKKAYKKGESGKPDPFVCFISTPKDAVQVSSVKWKNVKKTFGIGAREKAKGANGTVTRTMHGFPRTHTERGTYEPSWSKEEVHFIVQTHHESGQPIDLSGAMLHVSVYDGNKAGDPRLIGTFTLNLAKLIIASRDSHKKETNFSRMQQQLSIESDDDDDDDDDDDSIADVQRDVAPKRVRRSARRARPSLANFADASPFAGSILAKPSAKLRATLGNTKSIAQKTAKMSLYKSMRMQMSEHKEESSSAAGPVESKSPIPSRKARRASIFSSKRSSTKSNLDILDIFSLSIDEPLLKNGRRIGSIQCNIDTWWLELTLDEQKSLWGTSGKKSAPGDKSPNLGGRRTTPRRGAHLSSA